MTGTNGYDFSNLNAVFFNCTLKKSPAKSHTEGLIDASEKLMQKCGVQTEVVRPVDWNIANGVSPDMREEGWEYDDWPKIWEKVKSADILVLTGPIWLGDNSSIMKLVIERLYAHSGWLNEAGQNIFYGKVGGGLFTGNEDGVKHCSMNVLYSLQHIGCTIPPQADSGWIGEVGPGPSYLDENSGGPENDFTNRNLTFMTWNLMHIAQMLKDNGGVPAWGNMGDKWQEGERFGFERPQ